MQNNQWDNAAMMAPVDTFRTPGLGGMNVQIVKMIIKETGTFDQLHRRPYRTTADGHILRAFQEQLAGSTSFMPAQFGGLASLFATPSADPEQNGAVQIPNGWGQQRMRFALEVLISTGMHSKNTLYLFGYSDHNGITSTSALDPNMEFYINHTISLRESVQNTALGNQSYMSMLDNSQLLVGSNMAANTLFNPTPEQRMRPQDVYASMQAMHLNTSDVRDLRTTVTTMPAKSNRANNIPANYISRILQAGNKAMRSIRETGSNNEDAFSEARGKAWENQAAKDFFLTAIANVTGRPITNSFTLNTLRVLDPQVDFKIEARSLAPHEYGITPMAGQFAGWGATNLETQTAALLSQSVPAVMAECGLGILVFTVTNQTAMNAGPAWAVNNADGLGSVDKISATEIFKTRFESEILPQISFSNTVGVTVHMTVDLIGATIISISYDNAAPTEFLMPSFCDALTVPVITGDTNKLKSVTNDFHTLFTTVIDDCQGMVGLGATENSAGPQFGVC